MKKLIIPFLLAIILSQSTRGQEITNIMQNEVVDGDTKEKIGMQYGGIEVIYGNVKSVVQVRYIKKAPKNKLLSVDTMTYNEKGEITGRKLGDGHEGNFQFDRYEIYEKKTGTDSSTIVHHIDMNANDTGFDSYFKNDSLNFKKRLKYEFGDKLTEYLFYNSKEVLTIKKVYKYKKDGLLNEVVVYSTANKIRNKIFFIYRAFDQHGNWTNALEIWKTSNGKTQNSIIVKRELTYF